MKSQNLFLVMGLLSLISCSQSAKNSTNEPTDPTPLPMTIAPTTLALTAVRGRDVSLAADAACTDLDAKMQKLAIAQLEMQWQDNPCAGIYEYEADGLSDADKGPQDAAEAESTGTTLDYTEQNSQIQGVLEPDTVFTNGELIFALDQQNEIKIYQAWPADDLAVLSVIDRSTAIGEYQFAYINKMLLQDTHLVVFGYFYDANGYFDAFAVFDVSDPRAPTPVSATFLRSALPGTWQDARLQDGRLTHVFAQSIALPVESSEELSAFGDLSDRCVQENGEWQMTAGYQKAVTEYIQAESERLRALSIVDQLPEITTLDLQNDTKTTQTLGCSDVLVNDFTVGNNLTVVLNQSLTQTDDNAAFAVLGNTNTVYMNAQSLVLASDVSPFFYEILNDDETEITTSVLHRFAVSTTDTSLNYAASGIVPGKIPGAFAIDNDGTVTRVASQVFAKDAGDAPIDVTLHVLQETNGEMQPIGEIKDLVIGEEIFSARYVGDRLYLVTYQVSYNHDPLFVIDISDDSNPKVLGQMGMDGFSSYLQKISDTQILGVGYADATCWWTACWGEDYKISLFDVSDEAVPSELGQVVLPLTGGDAHLDALAVHYDADLKKMFLPIYVNHDWASGTYEYELSVLTISDDGVTETQRLDVASDTGAVLRTVLIGDGVSDPLLYIVGTANVEIVTDY